MALKTNILFQMIHLMSRGLAPVRVLVCRSVPNTRNSRPEDSSNPSDTSPHLKLWISVPVRIPKYVEQISHMEWTRARAEFVPKVPASYIFWRCSSLKTSAALGLLPRPCFLSDFCLLFNTSLHFANSTSAITDIFDPELLSYLSIDETKLLRLVGSYSSPFFFVTETRN